MKLLIGVMLASLSVSATADDWSGKVVGVHDGDTVTIMHAGKGIKIRLVEIDAPELNQSFGANSKQSLSDLCFSKEAKVNDQGTDKYGRTLGRINCAGIDANLEQAKRGMAWFYVQYGKDPAIKSAEEKAKADETGLWSETDPMPPWDFRHGGGKAKKAKAEKADDDFIVTTDCGTKTTCKQMSSCEEAKHYLNDCDVSRLDRDHDGIPCESLCR